ncbi:unnamed protein product [Urochloa humidicola]
MVTSLNSTPSIGWGLDSPPRGPDPPPLGIDLRAPALLEPAPVVDAPSSWDRGASFVGSRLPDPPSRGWGLCGLVLAAGGLAGAVVCGQRQLLLQAPHPASLPMQARRSGGLPVGGRSMSCGGNPLCIAAWCA